MWVPRVVLLDFCAVIGLLLLRRCRCLPFWIIAPSGRGAAAFDNARSVLGPMAAIVRFRTVERVARSPG